MAIKYKSLTTKLLELIKRNMQLGIEKLPSEKQLCNKYNVSRQTVRAALSQLEAEGIIEKRKGSGSYITALSSDPEKNIIAIIVSNENEYIYPTLLHNISKNLAEKGFHTKIFSTYNQLNIERNILLQLISEKCRGIIVEPCKSMLPNPNLNLYQSLSNKMVSILFINDYYKELNDFPYIKGDYINGIHLLLNHLQEMGHTNIGGIFKIDDNSGIEKYKSFSDYCSLNLDYIPDNNIGWFNSKDLYDLECNKKSDFIKKIVQDSLLSCTAIICHNDEIAYWLIRELKLYGRQLPVDVSIVSFDNSYLSETSSVPITSVGYRYHEYENTITTSFINLLKGLPVDNQEVPFYLSIKQSSLKTIIN